MAATARIWHTLGAILRLEKAKEGSGYIMKAKPY